MFKSSKFASVAVVFLSVGKGTVRFHKLQIPLLVSEHGKPVSSCPKYYGDNEYRTKMVVVHLEQYEKYSYF